MTQCAQDRLRFNNCWSHVHDNFILFSKKLLVWDGKISCHITDPAAGLKSLQFSAGSTSKHSPPPPPPPLPFTWFYKHLLFWSSTKSRLIPQSVNLVNSQILKFKASQYFETELYECIADSRIFIEICREKSLKQPDLPVDQTSLKLWTVATFCHRT